MSRRLGDDPLARARTSNPPPTAEAGGEQPTIRYRRSSYNDVFFQRRESVPIAPPPPQPTTETPEISEISQIPEIHDVVAAPPVAGEPESPAVAETRGAAQVNEVSATAPQGRENSFVAEVAGLDQAPASAATTQELGPAGSPIAAVDLPGPESAEEGPLAQSGGGLFKRLFGKFK